MSITLQLLQCLLKFIDVEKAKFQLRRHLVYCKCKLSYSNMRFWDPSKWNIMFTSHFEALDKFSVKVFSPRLGVTRQIESCSSNYCKSHLLFVVFASAFRRCAEPLNNEYGGEHPSCGEDKANTAE